MFFLLPTEVCLWFNILLNCSREERKALIKHRGVCISPGSLGIRCVCMLPSKPANQLIKSLSHKRVLRERHSKHFQCSSTSLSLLNTKYDFLSGRIFQFRQLFSRFIWMKNIKMQQLITLSMLCAVTYVLFSAKLLFVRFLSVLMVNCDLEIPALFYKTDKKQKTALWLTM